MCGPLVKGGRLSSPPYVRTPSNLRGWARTSAENVKLSTSDFGLPQSPSNGAPTSGPQVVAMSNRQSHLQEPHGAGHNGLAVWAPLVVRPSNRTNGNPLGGLLEVSLGSVKSAAPPRPASSGSVKPGVPVKCPRSPSNAVKTTGPPAPPLPPLHVDVRRWQIRSFGYHEKKRVHREMGAASASTSGAFVVGAHAIVRVTRSF